MTVIDCVHNDNNTSPDYAIRSVVVIFRVIFLMDSNYIRTVQ